MRRVTLVFAALLAMASASEQALAIELHTPEPLSQEAITTSLTDIDGNPASIADYRGRVVVLNFWATWCGPCRREMPSIGRLQETFDSEELIVLAVAIDRASPEKLMQFLNDTQASNLKVLRDTKQASMKSFQLRGLPATIVLDQDGHQVARHDGFESWDRPEILETLRGLLSQSI